jgi:hypothetical protein
MDILGIVSASLLAGLIGGTAGWLTFRGPPA